MNTRCYFDILDNCIAYDDAFGVTQFALNFSRIQPIDSGMYFLPFNLNPLGKSAEELYQYSKPVSLTEHVW